MDMDSQIFLSTLLYKNVVDRPDNMRHLSYKNLGPMLGTIENEVFINTHDREYSSIEKSETNMDDNIRYAYYNLLSLKDAKEKYQTDEVEEVVKKFKEEHERDSYYVIDANHSEPIIIKFDENKFKRIYESNVARPL